MLKRKGTALIHAVNERSILHGGRCLYVPVGIDAYLSLPGVCEFSVIITRLLWARNFFRLFSNFAAGCCKEEVFPGGIETIKSSTGESSNACSCKNVGTLLVSSVQRRFIVVCILFARVFSFRMRFVLWPTSTSRLNSSSYPSDALFDSRVTLCLS